MPKFNQIFPILLIIIMTAAMPSQAADNTKRQTIIVLDASGSMWGQVDGKAKIEVARGVIQELLDGWDTNVLLGITAYGHRSKGDCNDIESVYPVGTLNKAAALKVVNVIKPKGMTPLSQAVKTAADELKYTENKATVILLSDGKETCDMDPCALGKALEEKGVDFTAHVIGFDVAKAEQAGLKCLAENTGGLFIAAGNTAQLKSALSEAARIVAEKPPAIVGKGKLWLDKTEFSVGEPIVVHFEASDQFPENAWVGIVPSSIEHGSEARNDNHDVTYQYLKKRTSGTLNFQTPGGNDKYDFRMHDTDHSGNEVASVSFKVNPAKGHLSVDKTEVAAGAPIAVTFKVTEGLPSNAWIGIVPSNIPHGSEAQNDNHDVSYQHLRGRSAGTLNFKAPTNPGQYDFRAHDTDNSGSEIASVSFTVK